VADERAPLPRYRFEVGQELRYSGNDQFKFDGGVFDYQYSRRIWVVRQNGDGSWRLVLRYGSVDHDSRNSSAKGRETVNFAWCDIDPAGRLPENDSFGSRIDPSTLLVRLPDDQAALRSGWHSHQNQMLNETSQIQFLPDKSTSGKAIFELSRESPLNAIYGFELKDTITFDLARGVPAETKSYSKQTYGFVGEGHGTLKLDEIVSHDTQWITGFWSDAERYFAASKAFRDAEKTTDQSGAELEETFRSAIARYRAAKDEIKSPELHKQIDHDLKQHETLASLYLERANNRAAMLNQPAAEWTCSDYSGKEHSLKDYRGRVVVLDFWYRGCGWCIRAMPQVKEVAAHYAGEPVTVLGMNRDREDEDARFVIDKMALNYPNLKAPEVPEKYKVRGYPTLLIIDQQGILRDIHIGYAADLKQKVIEAIDRLLERKL